MGLGPLDLVSLSEARERAREARKLLLDGNDPIEHRRLAKRQARLEAVLGITFRECAERHIASHEAAWRNAKHRAQWRSTLSTYAHPVIGELPVSAIDTGLVLKVLEPIWFAKTETAHECAAGSRPSSIGPKRVGIEWVTIRHAGAVT
jgi:hypothetical protein